MEIEYHQVDKGGEGLRSVEAAFDILFDEVFAAIRNEEGAEVKFIHGFRDEK